MKRRKGTTARMPRPAATEDEILRALRRVIRAIDLYSRKLVTEFGLSGPQILCLRQLETHGPLSTGDLAAAMSLSAATVCGILDRLEARQFVVRERQVEDKRRVVVRLSAAGRAVVERAPPSLQDSFLSKLRALPRRERVDLERSLQKLVAMMSAEGIDAAPILATGDSVGADVPGERPVRSRKGRR
jgi:DNA-binding MarR family transcriptional regulator